MTPCLVPNALLQAAKLMRSIHPIDGGTIIIVKLMVIKTLGQT